MDPDPHSTMVMPDLPRGLPDMSMMQPEGARTPAPQLADEAPDPNTVPPARTTSAGLDMLLSQFSDNQILDEARMRGLL